MSNIWYVLSRLHWLPGAELLGVLAAWLDWRDAMAEEEHAGE
jgi:hypothetical protein